MAGVVRLSTALTETSLLYALMACGFYFASVACRHFCFAAAASFVIAPYAVLAASNSLGRAIGSLFALVICASIGALYQLASTALSSKGAREGQLLICSLAAMVIAENIETIQVGSSSMTLWSGLDVLSIFGDERPQLLVLILTFVILVMILVGWRFSLVGKIVRALIDSRLNLSLRGVPIGPIEVFLAAAGFVCLGLAGILWSLDGRVKPAMSTEVGVIGAVAFIVGTMFGSGISGVIVAALGLGLARFTLSFTLEGDWSMTAMLLVLAVAVLLRGRKISRFEPSP